MEIIFLLAGLTLIALGSGIVFAELQERRGLRPTPARVIGFSTGRSNRPNGPSFHCVAQYTGQDGRTYYIEGAIGSSVPLQRIADKVTVLVSPTEPEKAVLKSRLSFALGIILALMGLASALVFWFTFRASWYSVVVAAVIGIGFAGQIKKVWRKRPMTLEAWREHKKQIFSPRVFTDQSKDAISWADPIGLSAAIRSHERSNRLGVPLLLAAGIGFLFLSHYFYEKTDALVGNASRARGSVIRLHETDSGDESTTYAPVVEYRDDQGQAHTFIDSWSSSPPSYRIGDDVAVLYNSRNPREAQVDRGKANYWVSILIGSVGAVFTMIGILSLKNRLR